MFVAAQPRVTTGNDRKGDDDRTFGQPSRRRRTSSSVVAADCVRKPYRPTTEDEQRMSTLCQAALDNDPDEIGEKAAECRNISALGPEGCPPLHLGAHKGHVAVVHKLLALGAQLDARSVEGSTALHIAAKSGRKEIVKILNFARADLGATDWRGKTALHHVCEHARENGDAKCMAEALLHRGADVNLSDECGYTPLMLAMENLPLIKLLVELGTKPSTDQAALYVEQCRGNEGREQVLNLLVAEGWCPRFSNTSDDTSDVATAAAAAATACGTAGCESLPHQGLATGDAGELVEALSPREDPKVLGTWESTPLHGDAHSRRSHPIGSTPLRVGAKRGTAETEGDLLTASSFSATGDDRLERAPIANMASEVWTRDGQGRQAIPHAAASGKGGDVKSFLSAKVDKHSRDHAGFTPLHCAAHAGNVEAVVALLGYGARTDLTDAKGFTPLDRAVINHWAAVVAALLAGGATPGVGGERGPRPLHLACEFGGPDIVELLLRAGALPGHCWNNVLQSPLLEACFSGCLESVKLLLPRLSLRQINMRDRITGDNEGGTTALLAAIKCGDNKIDIVNALLEAGADPNIRMASTHVSPLETVVCDESIAVHPTLGPSLVRALVEAGADVDETGPYGLKALHYACHKGACGEVVKALLDAGADACAPCAGMQFLTPLQLAGYGGNPGALQVLIQTSECGGVDAVGAPPERATVLSLAVRAGKTEGVRFLLDEGANMDLLPFETDGCTPRVKSLVHAAISKGYADIACLLLQARRLKKESERKGWGQRMPSGCQLPQ